MAHSLVNAIDNDVGTLFQSQCTCIDDHIVITCVGPASASVLEIVVVSSGVNLVDALTGIVSIRSVLLH